MDEAGHTVKVCANVPRNSITLAAFCSDDFHAVLARNRIRAKKYAWYESVCLQLASGRHATLTLSHGRTFEVGLQPLNRRHNHPLRVCEADIIEIGDALGIARDRFRAWQCGDLLKWVPAGAEPAAPSAPPLPPPPRRLRKKCFASQVEALLAFARQPLPRIVNAAPKTGVVALKHVLAAPASPEALAWLSRTLRGHAPELLDFYARTDGAQLFVDARDEQSGLALLPIAAMDEAHCELDASLHASVIHADHDAGGTIDDDGRLRIDGVPSWWPTSLVFGAFGGAAERLYLATEGRHAGQVFAYEHDDDTSVRIAFSVNELFHAIHADPVGFVRAHFGATYGEAGKCADRAGG